MQISGEICELNLSTTLVLGGIMIIGNEPTPFATIVTLTAIRFFDFQIIFIIKLWKSKKPAMNIRQKLCIKRHSIAF